MKKISLIIQEFLKIFLIFLILFVWIRYMIRNLWVSVLISALCTTAIYLILLFLRKKRKIKLGMKIKEKEDAENMFLSMSFESSPMDFFYKLTSKRHQNIVKHRKYLSIDYSLEKVKTILWFDGNFGGLTIPRLCEIYEKVKKEKATKIVICCYEISDKNLLSFIHTFEEKIVILDRYQTYEKLYKLYDCFPKVTKTYPKEKSMAFMDLLRHSFNKKRTKGYLFSSMILILSGLFVRTSIYYCIIASLLIVFALISQFNVTYNSTKSEDIL